MVGTVDTPIDEIPESFWNGVGTSVDGLTLGTAGEYWRYEYSLRNQMTSAYKNGELVATYRYDARGLRVATEKPDEEETTYTVFGTAGEILVERTGTTQREYIYHGGYHLAASTGVVNGDGTVTVTEMVYLHTDQVGSITGISDEAGGLVWNGEYTPFGSPALPDMMSEWGWVFGGKGYDGAVELYYFNARWYDQTTGSFTSEDPARDGGNWYAYVGYNPLVYIDPTGLISDRAALAAAEEGRDDVLRTSEISGPDLGRDDDDDDRGRDSHLTPEQQGLADLAGRLAGARTNTGLSENVWERLVRSVVESYHRTRLLEELSEYVANGGDVGFLEDNTRIVVETGVYGQRGRDNWDGRLTVEFMGVELFETQVHTWSDDAFGATLAPGTYEGRFRADTWFNEDTGQFVPYIYSNAIALSGNGISRHDGFLIHSDVAPGSGLNPNASGLNVNFPGSRPYSQGCVITCGTDSFVDMTDTFVDMGFRYDNTEVIDVNIRPHGALY